MTDVLLYQTLDGAECDCINGTLQLTEFLETAFYLSLAGGNYDDPGGSDMRRSWWGNSVISDPSQRYRSRFQYLLQSLPVSTGNLRRYQSAALQDLAWAVRLGYVTENVVSVGIPSRGRLSVRIETELRVYDMLFDSESTI